MLHTVHIPLDFELREEVRLLTSALAPGHSRLDGAQVQGMAVLYCFRLWCDYGRAGSDWRPLPAPWPQDGEPPYDWRNCRLAGLIEDYCGYNERGTLVPMLLESNVLYVETRRPSIAGLTLAGFARFNPHLLPDFRSTQSRGGMATARKKRDERLVAAASQQERILFDQGKLTFTETEPPSRDETKSALLLVMKIDAACGRALRSTGEYEADPALLGEALRRTRQFTSDEIDRVLELLNDAREDITVPKDTAVILRDFAPLLEMATS